MREASPNYLTKVIFEFASFTHSYLPYKFMVQKRLESRGLSVVKYKLVEALTVFHDGRERLVDHPFLATSASHSSHFHSFAVSS